MGADVDLAAFAASGQAPRRGPEAWLTTIPELNEVVSAYQAGTSVSTIRAWLIATPGNGGCGYDSSIVPGRNTLASFLQKWYHR